MRKETEKAIEALIDLEFKYLIQELDAGVEISLPVRLKKGVDGKIFQCFGSTKSEKNFVDFLALFHEHITDKVKDVSQNYCKYRMDKAIAGITNFKRLIIE